MRKAVIVLSGGQDSTTVLFDAMRNPNYDEVHAVTFDYGQKHSIEIEAAQVIARLARVRTHEIIIVPDILRGTSPLVNKKAELEQYKDFNSLPGGLEKTFVPMRNQFFLTVAANRAIVMDASTLITGVCQEDFGGYPDCRAVFINALEEAIRRGTALQDGDPFSDFRIVTPLMHMTKADSIHFATNIPGCYGALGFSHTSYDGNYPPTGHDHATLLRAKGFYEAGVPDPLIVRAYWEGKMELPVTDNYMRYLDRIKGGSPWLALGSAPIQTPEGVMAHHLERIVHHDK